MLTYPTPNCLAKARSSAVKSPGICKEILMPGESGSSGRPPAKTGPAPRPAAPTARTKSRRFKVQLPYLIASTSVSRFIESKAPHRKRSDADDRPDPGPAGVGLDGGGVRAEFAAGRIEQRQPIRRPADRRRVLHGGAGAVGAGAGRGGGDWRLVVPARPA